MSGQRCWPPEEGDWALLHRWPGTLSSASAHQRSFLCRRRLGEGEADDGYCLDVERGFEDAGVIRSKELVGVTFPRRYDPPEELGDGWTAPSCSQEHRESSGGIEQELHCPMQILPLELAGEAWAKEMKLKMAVGATAVASARGSVCTAMGHHLKVERPKRPSSRARAYSPGFRGSSCTRRHPLAAAHPHRRFLHLHRRRDPLGSHANPASPARGFVEGGGGFRASIGRSPLPLPPSGKGLGWVRSGRARVEHGSGGRVLTLPPTSCACCQGRLIPFPFSPSC